MRGFIPLSGLRRILAALGAAPTSPYVPQVPVFGTWVLGCTFLPGFPHRSQSAPRLFRSRKPNCSTANPAGVSPIREPRHRNLGPPPPNFTFAEGAAVISFLRFPCQKKKKKKTKTPNPGHPPLKKFITTFPVVFGALIGTTLVGAILAMEIRLPGISHAWDTHIELVRSIWCTQTLFGLCIYHLWTWRHVRGFWQILLSFFAIHILGIFLFSIKVHPLRLQEWVGLLVFEALFIAYPLRWALQATDRQR